MTQKLGDHVIVRVSGTGKPLKVTDMRRTGSINQDVRLTYDAVSGAKYFIQSSSNLSSGLTEQTNIVAGAGSTTNVLPGAGGAAQKNVPSWDLLQSVGVIAIETNCPGGAPGPGSCRS